MATSLAMYFDISIEDVVRLVGHDGSEYIGPLISPQCFRGFNGMDILKLAYQYGLLVFATPEGTGQYNMLKQYPGILTFTTMSGHGHAVATDGQMIYDPSGFIRQHINGSDFVLWTFVPFPKNTCQN